MHIFYRICDLGKKPLLQNNYVLDKLVLLDKFLHIFKNHPTYVFADNCSDEYNKVLLEKKKSGQIENLFYSSLGNTKSFLFMFEIVKHLPLSDNTAILFQEDDYLYLPNSDLYLDEGLSLAPYVSLYDHPDKYKPGINPFIIANGEQTVVMLTQHCHWKYTNSTTMTFASTFKVIQEDAIVLQKSCSIGEIPDDFLMFVELYKKGRSLVTPLPGRATHCDGSNFAPLIDWRSVYETSN